MWIALSNRHARVARATPAERDWLRKYLSFPDADARWKGKTEEEAVHHLYEEVSATFPSGFLTAVQRAAEDDGVKVEVVDNREVPCGRDPDADLAWLKPHQLEGVDRCVERGRGILQHVTGCLAGSTVVEVNRAGKSFRMSIADVVARFNGARITWANKVNKEKGRGMRWDPEIPTMIRSRDEDGFIRLHTIAAALASGVKPVYELQTTTGRSITATADHRFLTDSGWQTLGELHVGSRVFVDVGIKSSGAKKAKPWYELVSVKAHPHRDALGRYPKHRLVAEAALSGVSYEDLVKAIRTFTIVPLDGALCFLDPKQFHVHHLDEDTHNNAIDNLVIMPSGEHAKHHGRTSNWRHVTARTGLEGVVSIRAMGDLPTYDIALTSEPHNFIADGFVVHNSGKTEIAVALTRALPCEWLFLAPSLTLVNNAADRFIKRNLEHGVDLGEPGRIGEGKWTEGRRLTCATYQSIHRALGTERCRNLLGRVGGVGFDEMHVVPAVTFLATARHCNAYYRIGFSATPLARGDMKGALSLGAIGPVIHKVGQAELVASGDISRGRVRFHKISHPFPDGFTYPEVYDELVVRSPKRNALLTSLAKAAEKPALLFVRNIAHGRALVKLLRAAGVRSEFVWGTHNAQQIDRHVAALVRGDVDVVVTSAVLKQGIDVPSLRTVIMGASGKSVIDTLQKLGRGSRIDRDARGNVVKDEFTVLDVYDVGNDWLEKHSKARKSAFIAEGYELVVLPQGSL